MVVTEDRGKATAVWLTLLALLVTSIGYLSLNSLELRKNPPVEVKHKVPGNWNHRFQV